MSIPSISQSNKDFFAGQAQAYYDNSWDFPPTENLKINDQFGFFNLFCSLENQTENELVRQC